MKSISQVISCKITVYYEQFIFINYVSEHRLSHAVDASYSTPTTRVNRDFMLLKLIERHYLCFRSVRIYSGSRPRRLALNLAVLLGTTVTI